MRLWRPGYGYECDLKAVFQDTGDGNPPERPGRDVVRVREGANRGHA